MDRPAELALTVLGRDRPGIAAEVLGALATGGAAIVGARGGSVAGRFSFIVVVEADCEDRLRQALGDVCARLGLDLMVTGAEGAAFPRGADERAVLSCYGPADHAAVVELFGLLGRHRVNVEDFRFERLEGRGTARLRGELQVRVPVEVDLEAVLGDLRELEERTGLESSLRSDVAFLI